MPRQIDHVVLLVRDLAATVADYTALGFTVTPGGAHTGGATHNALISFADGSYIELIAFLEPDRPQEHGWWPYLAKGEGWVDFALLEDDIDDAAARVAAAGIAVQGPSGNGRTRPDGQAVAWRAFRPAPPDGVGFLPFAITDVTPRDLRVPGGAAAAHRLPATRVAGATVVVADLARARMAWGQYLGTRGAPYMRKDGSPAWHCPIGEQRLTLVEPVDHESDTARHLRERGEGLYEVTFGGAPPAPSTPGTLLDLTATHGARLRLMP